MLWFHRNDDPLYKVYLEELKTIKRPMVVCSGVFDIFHIGHLEYLKESRKRKKSLVVLVTSDRFVDKGNGRPYFSERYRMEILYSLKCVNHVILNDYPDCSFLLRKLKPEYYSKGIEYEYHWTEKLKNEKEQLNRNYPKGRLIFTKTVQFHSTDLLEKMK